MRLKLKTNNMSDTIKKYKELVEAGKIDPRHMPIKQDDKIYITALENKLHDIAWHLQEYYGNMSDKDYLINKIDKIINTEI
tara:strand:- start:1360 stop:1602 length:243 start_codon:yes stop_codon:yes gene_type:complete